MKARIRGIYTTALTRLLLDADHEVVQASPPIRRRFDAELPPADHDVSVETTGDRQGVGVDGDPRGVAEAVSHLRTVGVDELAWADPAPAGAVFDGEVVETLGSGAVVDLGSSEPERTDVEDVSAARMRSVEGFLPFDDADGYVDDGDTVRVQVSSAAPPWSDDRPLLDTSITAVGGLAALVRGQERTTVDTYDDEAGRELAGMTDLLGADVPDGWGVRWSRDATDASMDALGDALERASTVAADLSAALDDAGPVDPSRRLVAPTATAWVWFGRDCRFGLDEARRAVTTTMPGHHRTKAADETASAGVDFVEALCDVGRGEFDGDMDFPFEVVTDKFGPVEGDTVRIGHGKPDGRLLILGRGEVTERDADGSLTVRREMTPGGTYDELDVERESGDVAVTKFREGRWWYPTVYRDEEGDRKGTYVNICTPVECFPNTIRYVDLHVDVVKHRDGRVERVDDDELDDAVERGFISEELAEKARSVASALERAL